MMFMFHIYDGAWNMISFRQHKFTHICVFQGEGGTTENTHDILFVFISLLSMMILHLLLLNFRCAMKRVSAENILSENTALT